MPLGAPSSFGMFTFADPECSSHPHAIYPCGTAHQHILNCTALQYERSSCVNIQETKVQKRWPCSGPNQNLCVIQHCPAPTWYIHACEVKKRNCAADNTYISIVHLATLPCSQILVHI